MRLPVRASSARIVFAKRLSPIRFPPKKSDDAEPVAAKRMPRLTSMVTPDHAFAPPLILYDSGDHVS